MILVVSHPADDHATSVLAELDRIQHAAVLIDTNLFPSRASLTQRFDGGRPRYEFSTNGHRIDLAEAGAGWWRRPQPFTLEPGIAPDAASFAYTECHEAVAGLWAALGIAWVNPPERDEVAHHKPYQLATAIKVGLSVPRTVITNDPAEARRLIAELGAERTVYKTFLASEECWRETRVLRPEELALLDRVQLAPVIFQEYVPAVADIRVTVIGPTIFATAISAAPGGYDLDYRMDLAGACFEATVLPATIETKIHALMNQLGLLYGAIDLRRTPDGGYVFLEVNPAGEWRFVEDRTHQPITSAMAAFLAELDGRRG
jgi:glutathione synthase/RimK-type ligase-like ATP-grasp enzyme